MALTLSIVSSFDVLEMNPTKFTVDIKSLKAILC